MSLLGTRRIRTTAYHPIANGIIERFHRQLKAALKCQPIPNDWVTSLPLILLGIRATFKNDLQCSTAELVYGTTLRLPGEFFDPSSSDHFTDPTAYVTKLRTSMEQLRAVPTRLPKQRKVHVEKALSSCTHVFVRHDAVRTPLQPPYDGPYKVLKRLTKAYVVHINGQDRTISLNRLKPALMEPDEQQPLQTSTSTPPHTVSPSLLPPTPRPSPVPQSTRSGRHVHWPQRLHDYVP